jgi:hypothetical protein
VASAYGGCNRHHRPDDKSPYEQEWRSASLPGFVILWRSKERSDAAQTIGSMPRLSSAAAVKNSAPLCPLLRSRHGSSGLRDGASLLLRPWMTKLGGLRYSTLCRSHTNDRFLPRPISGKSMPQTATDLENLSSVFEGKYSNLIDIETGGDDEQSPYRDDHCRASAVRVVRICVPAGTKAGQNGRRGLKTKQNQQFSACTSCH